jgi:hypothetical protein
MATNKRVGEYDEVSFIPLIKTLRTASVDTTVPEGDFVGLYKTVYDMVSTKGEVSNISSLRYDPSTNSFIITYENGNTESIQLSDKYLSNASFDEASGKASFVMNNGESVQLDLNGLISKSELEDTVDELNKKIDSIDSSTMKWESF